MCNLVISEYQFCRMMELQCTCMTQCSEYTAFKRIHLKKITENYLKFTVYMYFPIVRKKNSTIYFFICWTFRFMSASVEHNIQTYILELVHDQLTRRQTLDSITRNLLKLLTVTCGYSQIRLLVSQRLEMWLQNPKVCICLFVCFFTLMLYAKWWFNWT